jgi:hypothetical protein
VWGAENAETLTERESAKMGNARFALSIDRAATVGTGAQLSFAEH